MSFLEDERIRWIRQRVVLALDIPSESFDEYFKDSLERARSAGAAREQLSSYLTSKHSTGSAVFFSARKWKEDVEGIMYFACVYAFFSCCVCSGRIS